MIYIHIPFCHRKCVYCAFYSIPSQQLRRNYVDSLISEMVSRKDEIGGFQKSVYFGGGTPSILSVEELSEIVDSLRHCFDLSMLEEATIECNPEDITEDYIQQLAELKFFNRVSIGVQSMDDAVLRFLNRRHSPQQVRQSVSLLHDYGFKNISVDIIYGIPSMSNALLQQTLTEVVGMGVQHISAYSLTLEPDTMLAINVEKGRVIMPSDEQVVEQYFLVKTFLEQYGYHQYEVSNYCKEGFFSRQNSGYWSSEPYLGLGAAAHSFDGHRRRWNISDVKQYISSHFYEEEVLSAADLFNEKIMTGLRTVMGVPKSAIPTEFATTFEKNVKKYLQCGWISDTGTHYSPTPTGLLHADGMAAALFIPPQSNN